ncbi:putative integral membrane protein [Acanthocheilonema viteae]
MNESFALLIFAALSACFVCSSKMNNKLAFVKLFGNKQFFFISLSHCQLLTEEVSPLNTCPYRSIIRMSSLSDQFNCSHLTLHLISRDNEVPKILILGAKRIFGNLIAQQLRIPLPKQKHTFTYTHVNLESSYYYIGNNLLQKQVIATFFDSNQRMLYVLRNVTLFGGYFTLECINFYVQFLSNDRLNFFELNTFRNIHPSNNDRILWTEDSFHRKFYYVKKRFDNKIVIYSIPCEDIMQTLLDGKPGIAVQMLGDVHLHHLSVSRGIAVIHALDDGNTKHLITNLYESSLMITCNVIKLPVRSNPSGTIILFNDQLCAVQKASGSNCTMTNQSLIDKRYQDYLMHPLFYGIVALIFLLLLALIQLLICLYRYRNSAERLFTRDNCLQIHYYPSISSDFSFQF